MEQAYDSLAEWFEYLNDDCDYPSWSQYFIDGLRKFKCGDRGLEIGCGSGAFTRALVKAGYRMDGADQSVPMLTKATELAREEGLAIDFMQADALTFSVPHQYDFILSPNDCYNYIPQHNLQRAFRRAYRALKRGGVFWFDISSAYKLREKIANNIFADDREDVTYLSFNTLKDACVEMDVTIFARQDNGLFHRFDERHTQYIHEERDVAVALQNSGFELLSVEGHLGKSKEGSDRLNFICQKK